MILLRRSNRIFFGIKFHDIPVSSNFVLDSVNLFNTLTKFWDDIIIPGFKDSCTEFVTIQVRIRTLDNQWRNLGSFTSYRVNEFQELIKYLNVLLMTTAAHYKAEGFNTDLITVAYKFLNEDDIFIKMRTLDHSPANFMKNMNKFASLVPTVWDLAKIKGASLIRSKFEKDLHYLENLKILGDKGKEILNTVWEIRNIDRGIRFIRIFERSTNKLLTTFTDKVIDGVITDAFDENITFERKFHDGTIITIGDNLLTTRQRTS